MGFEHGYLHLAGFLFCAGVILFSGSRLARYGDAIAELTGLGKAWIGLVLMAAVTSLPELVTGISSVTLVNEPDLAAGGVLGSCVFNLLILSFIDVQVRQPITSLVKSSQLFAGLLGIVLISISGLAILVDDMVPVVLWFSPFSIVLILVYLFSVRGLYQFELNHQVAKDPVVPGSGRRDGLRKAVSGYIIHAIIVFAAALFLPVFSEYLAEASGLGNTFFGTLFLAATTSLPEVVVSVAAIRMQAYDMAVGNIFGSNIFNIFILAVDDFFYRKGSIYGAIDPGHLLSVLFVVLMSAVAGLGLMVRSGNKYWKLGADTLLIALLYLLMLALLYFSV